MFQGTHRIFFLSNILKEIESFYVLRKMDYIKKLDYVLVSFANFSFDSQLVAIEQT